MALAGSKRLRYTAVTNLWELPVGMHFGDNEPPSFPPKNNSFESCGGALNVRLAQT
jgi:hypothetical protein